LLIDIVVSDTPKNKFRFTLRYLILSTRFNYRLSLITKTKELVSLLSTISLYRTANWIEREIWDLYGIFFFLHNDLRRILTEYGFTAHPLRKDFPLTGFFEVIYDDSQKRIVKKSLELSQEYRFFDFNAIWSF
jgi:NADH dehydrogenase (ubiquinone) Fe-S protein 3